MRYTNIGEEVTVPGTLVQATIALDVAGKLAQENKNQSGMLDVAHGWMKLAGLMADLEEAEEKKHKPEEPKVPLGFQPSNDDEDNEIEEEDAGSGSEQLDDDESASARRCSNGFYS